MALKKCILFLLKLQYRIGHKDAPIDFCAHLRASKKFLVSVPTLVEERKALQLHLKKLPALFPEAEIYFITQDGDNLSKKIPTARIIPVGRQQLSYNFYPNHTLREEIKKLGVDVFIDFNKHFDFLSTILCVFSGAKVRICLEDVNREPFFNLHIKAAPASSGARSYKSIINFIEFCRTR